MSKRVIALVATLVGAFALLVGPVTTGASAVATVPMTSANTAIYQYGSDAMGADVVANRNKEFVAFKNTDGVNSVNIDGLTVMDEWRKNNLDHSSSCNKYTINGLPGQGTASVLAVGETVVVYNGWGVNAKAGNVYRLYVKSNPGCGANGHFYSNNDDTIFLYKTDDNVAAGELLDSVSWDWNGGYSFGVAI